jgi:D-alanyl-D-alanine-carboxypeptidase/D-alanyl-D-alanine-endopeptidase
VTPFDGNTVFEIGSITKTFTAALLANMVKSGEVKLDDPVEKYLPYEFLAGCTLPRGIGEKYEYSNLAVGLLGQALSHRAGKGYEALVSERVLRPLGMHDTRITLNASMQARLAPGHYDTGTPAKNWDLPTSSSGTTAGLAVIAPSPATTSAPGSASSSSRIRRRASTISD